MLILLMYVILVVPTTNEQIFKRKKNVLCYHFSAKHEYVVISTSRSDHLKYFRSNMVCVPTPGHAFRKVLSVFVLLIILFE